MWSGGGGGANTAVCAVLVRVGHIWVEAEGVCCEVDCETEGYAGGTLGVPVVDGDALGVPVADGVTLERVVLPIEGVRVRVGAGVGVYKGVKVLALNCSSRKSGVPRPVTYVA
jgi:hypothetical protein